MKIFQFSGSYQLEVVLAESEEQAWQFLMTHYRTGGTLDYLKEQWHVAEIFDPASITVPTCVGHYSE